MGVGPAVAIPAAVKSAGLQLDDIDLFEINEVVALVLSLINFFNFINATGLSNHATLLLHLAGICIPVCILP